MTPLTQEQFWASCDARMSDPVPLSEADVSKPFVYDRTYGFFYVPMGYHQAAMSLLLAFHHGKSHGIDVAEHLGLRFSEGTADAWLETVPGACFRSSQGRLPSVWALGGLTFAERQRLGDVRAVGDPDRPRPKVKA